MPDYSADEFFRKGKGIVTLCGSTKYFFEYQECTRILTFKEWIVLSCGSFGHSFHKYAETKSTNYEDVKRLHFSKIQMSNAIVVVSDLSAYIGDSTKAEIEFAKFRQMPVFYFDGYNFTGTTGESPTNHLQFYELHVNDYINNGGSLGIKLDI